MKTKSLQDLFLAELKDLYDAENRLVKALPKMARAASSEDLRKGFQQHLEQTREHVTRLKDIFTSLGKKPAAEKCLGIVGLLQEGDHLMRQDFEGSVMDAALISAAQRVEHYEIAAYGCVSAWAELLGETNARALLEKTLGEEKETNGKLTELSKEINAEANAPDSSDEKSPETGRAKARSARA